MITLYSPHEVDFTHDGLGILNEALRCVVTRDIGNSPYWEVELEYPTYSSKADRITELCILKVPTPSGLQLFRIKEVNKDFESITVSGDHIVFDLAKNFVKTINIKNATRQQAIQSILDHAISKHNFRYVGTDNNTVKKDIELSARNVLDCIMGSENSVFSVWGGGQLEIDNFNISSKDELGTNRGLFIAFGKNMTGINSATDTNEVVTRIIPVSGDGIMLPEVFIDSKYINNYHQPLTTSVTFSDIKVVEAGDDTEEVTQEMVYELLREEAKKMFESGVDIPNISYEVSFVDLGNTKEYEKFKGMHILDIGDTIRVENELFNIDLDMKVRNYSYNALTEEFENLKIGTEATKMSTSLKSLRSTVDTAKDGLKVELTEINNSLSQKINKVDNRVDVTNRDVTDVDKRVDTTNQALTNIRNELKLEIDKKVEELDVKKIISNARTEVRTALNNNVINYGNNNIVAMHNVGTTTLNENGLVYSNGAFTSNYLFLKHSQEFETIDENEFEITLPAQFKGRDFTAFVSLVDTMETLDPWLLNRVNLTVNRVDTVDGKVFVTANKVEVDKNDFNITRVQPIKAQLLVIA